MNILTIDTSTELEIIGLRFNNKITQIVKPVSQSHSSTLFANLETLLNKANCSMNQIDLIGTGIGPGSFTGIRIAVTTARMMAQQLHIPLTGFSTHEFFAHSAADLTWNSLIIAFDAKKNRVFGALYKKQGDEIIEIIRPGDYEIEKLGHAASEKIIAIGDGISKYKDRLNAVCSYHFIENYTPGAEQSIVLTEKNYRENKDRATDINNTLPCYTRKSDAEIAREKQTGN